MSFSLVLREVPEAEVDVDARCAGLIPSAPDHRQVQRATASEVSCGSTSAQRVRKNVEMIKSESDDQVEIVADSAAKCGRRSQVWQSAR